MYVLTGTAQVKVCGVTRPEEALFVRRGVAPLCRGVAYPPLSLPRAGCPLRRAVDRPHTVAAQQAQCGRRAGPGAAGEAAAPTSSYPPASPAPTLSHAQEIAAAAKEGGAEPVGVFVDEDASAVRLREGLSRTLPSSLARDS